MPGGTIEVTGNAGDFVAEYLSGGEVIVHGDCGDLPGVEMRGGTLVIGGDCTRPCGNMTGGTCMVFGNPRELLPSFYRNGSAEAEFLGKKFRMAVYRGDVANRGKGTLMVREGEERT